MVHALPPTVKDRCGMLMITVVEEQRRRRVIAAPSAAELTRAYQAARADLQDRELIVDLRSLTAIGPPLKIRILNRRQHNDGRRLSASP